MINEDLLEDFDQKTELNVWPSTGFVRTILQNTVEGIEEFAAEKVKSGHECSLRE